MEAEAEAKPNLDGLEAADNFFRFLVLGGGISGLSAASHLAKCGANDFRLLEARNRLGGRIMTMQIGKLKIRLNRHGL